MTSLTNKTAVVVGASRGLGSGIATALAEASATVIAVSRTKGDTPTVENGAGSIRLELADAAEASVAADVITRYSPDILVLVAGASPQMHPLREQTWETFSVNWESDVRIAFHWLRESLVRPLAPGSKVIVISSGAALNGSPLSGGYAGAKATQRFITKYARDEAERADLDISFTTILPRFAPLTGVGRPAVAAYAAEAGLSVGDFLERLPFATLTAEEAGAAVVELAEEDSAELAPEYLLTGAGLRKVQ
jgi:3-oxoacyl-[acyl-carrier protein] reductase